MILSPLFSLALVFAAASPASEPAEPTAVMVPDNPSGTLSPARAQAIGRLAPNWNAYRSRAHRMMDGYAAAAARDGWDRASLDKMISQVRVLTSNIEKTQAAAADLAREAIRASEPPSAARTERENAVTALFEGRMLTIYANLVPRVLNEACTDRSGRFIGRVYAGSEWTVPPLTYDEGGYYSAWQVLRAGFTGDEYHEFENRASDALNLPRPKP